jgi:S-adenosylmethionine uptake transporter
VAVSPTLKGAAFGLLAFGAYAAYDISAKVLGGGIHPLQIIAISGLFHLPLLLAYAWWDRGSLRPARQGLMALRAVGTVINFTAGVSAFTMLPLAEAYVIFFTMPLLIAVLAVPVLGERFDPVRGMAVVLGLAGVIKALDPATTPLGPGHALALLGASVGAMNYVIIRKTGGVERTPVMLLWPQLALMPVVLAATPFVYVPMAPAEYAVAAFMAVVLLIGAVAIVAAYRRAAAIVVAPMQYSQIGWAALLGVILFDEQMTQDTLTGCALIALAGVIVVARQDRPAKTMA